MASGLPLSSHVPRSEHAFNWWPNAYLHTSQKQWQETIWDAKRNSSVWFGVRFLFKKTACDTHLINLLILLRRSQADCFLFVNDVFHETQEFEHALWFYIKWFLLRSVLLCTRCLWFSGRRVSVWRWSVEISLQCSWGHLVDKSWTSPSCRFSPLPTRASAWAS